MNREKIEKLMVDAGHAINHVNGQCPLVEDVLCRVTGLCCDLLNDRDRSPSTAKPWMPTLSRTN